MVPLTHTVLSIADLVPDPPHTHQLWNWFRVHHTNTIADMVLDPPHTHQLWIWLQIHHTRTCPLCIWFQIHHTRTSQLRTWFRIHHIHTYFIPQQGFSYYCFPARPLRWAEWGKSVVGKEVATLADRSSIN
jgi:hypothetical protein